MSKWSDFLLTLAVRFLCGALLGTLACLFFSYRGILRSFSHEQIRSVIAWLGLWSLCGALVAVFTTPYWQRPWYKGIGGRRGEDDRDPG